MRKKMMMVIMTLFIAAVLAACGGNNNSPSNDNMNQDNSTENTEMNETSSSEEGASSGEVPDDLSEADNPEYEVGSEAEIDADHMEGMDGAEATIEGAYDTTVYEVTYTPTDGGEKVENHKWVIHEETEDADEQPHEKGDEVVLEADHMEGMQDAEATIDDAKDTTVYMVTYNDTETGEKVENHKWVVEDELSPIE